MAVPSHIRVIHVTAAPRHAGATVAVWHEGAAPEHFRATVSYVMPVPDRTTTLYVQVIAESSDQALYAVELRVRSPGTVPWLVLTLTLGVLVLLVAGVAAFLIARQRRRNRDVRGTVEVAEAAALAIAEMRLADLEYLNDIPDPNAIQKSFITILGNLKEYRTYLPASILSNPEDQPQEVHPCPQGTPSPSAGAVGQRDGCS